MSVRRIAIACATRHARNQLDGIVEKIGNCRLIDAPLEAVARISRKSKLPASGSHNPGIERSRLEKNVGGFVGDLTSLSTDYAGDRLRTTRIGDHGHGFVER